MGFKDVNWATTLDLPFAQKSVLIAICIRTDDKTHETIAGQQTIADMLGANEKTVRRAVDVLEALGILTRERRTGTGGYRTTDRIVVDVSYRSESPVVQSNDLPDSEPSGQRAQWAVSPNLPDSVSSPTGQRVRAEEINQIDQPDDQPGNAHDADPGLIPSTDIESVVPNVSFDDFWSTWPRKDDKKSATVAWAKAIRRAPAQLIVDRARTYATSPHRPAKQFVPYGATWLNGDRWNDPPPEPPEADQRRQTNTQKNLAYLATLQAREHAENRGLSA